MYGCESWTIKKAECQGIDAFELWCWRRLESPLDFKEIQPVHPKGDQSWVFISPGLMLKLKLQYFGHLMRRADSFEKTLMLGKIWGQEEKGTTDDEMVEWHHLHNGHGFGWTPGIGDGQGGLVCCSSWGHKELDTTEWLNWTEIVKISRLNCWKNKCQYFRKFIWFLKQCISYLYCSVTNYPATLWFNTPFIASQLLWIRNLSTVYLGLVSRVSHMLQLRCWLRLVISWGRISF